MEGEITKTLIESPYPFWFTIILFAVISGLIQCIISFFIEKGKNLATKKDISDITNKIESVKDSYNKALESHKIELQKEFESHKYIMGLCRSLDNILLKHISACLKADSTTSVDYHVNNIKLLMENSKLASFLNTYKYRYDSCHILMNLRTLSESIDFKFHDMEYRTIQDVDGGYYHEIPYDEKEQLLKLLNQSLMYFLPPINKKPEA